MAKDNFIFISDKMIEMMRDDGLEAGVYSFLSFFKDNHLHRLSDNVIPMDDCVYTMSNALIQDNKNYDPWSEESIDAINKDKNLFEIAVCDMTEYVNNKPCYLLTALFRILCAYIKAGGLVIINNIPIMDCKELQTIKDEKIKNQEYLTKIN